MISLRSHAPKEFSQQPIESKRERERERERKWVSVGRRNYGQKFAQ
jgi:hypothetical protein